MNAIFMNFFEPNIFDRWPREREQELEELLKLDLSASKIAEKLGVSRNAVIGKANRLGLQLSSHREPISSTKPASAPAVDASADLKAKARQLRIDGQSCRVVAAMLGRNSYWVKRVTRGLVPTVTRPRPKSEGNDEPESIAKGAFMALPGATRIGILDLTATTCRWPIGDPCKSSFGYCGQSCDPDRAYCEHHRKISWRPPNVATPTVPGALRPYPTV